MREGPASTTLLEAAEASFWATFIRNRNVDAATSSDGALAVCGGFALCVVGTFLTVAIGLGSRRPLRAEDLAAVEAFYAARGLRPRLELDADVVESERALLEGRGYAVEPLVLAVLARDTAEAEPPGESAGDRAPSEIAVRTTADERMWAALSARAQADSVPEDGLDMLRRTVAVTSSAAHVRAIAALGGRDAGVGAFGISGEAALFFGATVLPEYRGHGIQRALLRARLKLAGARGASIAFLKAEADSASERAALATGFVRVTERRRLHGPAPVPAQ